MESFTKEKTRELIINKSLLITDESRKTDVMEVAICNNRRYMLKCLAVFLSAHRKKEWGSSCLNNEIIDDVWKRVQVMNITPMDLHEMEAVCIAIDYCVRCMLNMERYEGFSKDEYRFFREAEKFVLGYKIASCEGNTK